MVRLTFLLGFLLSSGQLLAQTVDTTLPKFDYERLFDILKPKYQHQGLKIRFDVVGQIPIYEDIRITYMKIIPGFGFNLGIGYGFTDYFSVYAGFISLSHNNYFLKAIKSEQVGFDGFHAELKYKFNPWAKNQLYVASGIGFFEIVDQKAEGFTGSGYFMETGFDRNITNEFTIGVGLQYRRTLMPVQILNSQKINLPLALKADMFVIQMSMIYTFSEEKGFF